MPDVKADIHHIITVLDNHDAGIYPQGIYVCPCRFRGTEQEWEQHIADVIERELTEQLELPDGVL